MATKQKESWVCTECGHAQIKWSGSCLACKSWGTVEKFLEAAIEARRYGGLEASQVVRIDQVELLEVSRDMTGIGELDRLLGGGIVSGSLTLLGGDPGIGKSTLMLMIADSFSKKGKKVLYVCGEESVVQTSLRAKRLGIKSSGIFLLSETLFENITAQVENVKPDFLIIDSIQIVYKGDVSSLPGSPVQVKEIAMECMHIAKKRGITTFVIGHVTKSGEIAGPRILEHIVDTVLDFEGDPDHGYRILRAHKNRFGPTDEVSIFQMCETGLEEVPNPSEIFLQERSKETNGSVIVPTMEGTRSILVEIQALVSSSAFPTSSRRGHGIDQNRLALLLAVLEKRTGYHFHNLDVFVSIAGGLRVREPATDLAIISAIASSFNAKAVDSALVVIGEVGLGGEVRSVSRIESRLREAEQMGFTRCIIPERNMVKKLKTKMEVIGVSRIEQAMNKILG